MRDYRLVQAHRINKVLQPVGAEVELPEQTGDWLVSQAIAVRVEQAVVPRAPSVPALLARAPRAQFVAPASPRFKCCGWNT
jgi:hypothetical protein